MRIENAKTIDESDQCRFLLSEDGRSLLFEWRHVEGLSARDFGRGIAAFADHCSRRRPDLAVIDATRLDQNSPAVAWLRGQTADEEGRDYQSWWISEIVPVYNEAGISALTVATGDPNAPGELRNLPGDVRFRVGYFPDLVSAMNFNVSQPAA